MIRFLLATMLVLGGCAVESDSPFGGGGSSGGDDDTGGEGDGGASGDGVPEVTGVQASVAFYPDFGNVLEVSVSYNDAEDDLEGGVVHLRAEGDIEGQEALGINGSDAYMDEGLVKFSLADVSSNPQLILTISLEDEAGHRSDDFVYNH